MIVEYYKVSFILYYILISGVLGFVQAAACVSKTISSRVDVHAQRASSQMPRAVRTREGHQGGQSLAGAVGQVSQPHFQLAFLYPYITTKST